MSIPTLLACTPLSISCNSHEKRYILGKNQSSVFKVKAPSLVEEESAETVVRVLMNVDFLCLHSEWLMLVYA